MELTVLDAGVVIAVLDAADAHHDHARRALALVSDRGDRIVVPASAYAEILVAPFRARPPAAAAVDEFLDALPATIDPATREIARAAAQLRARHGRSLRLPDALVIATGMALGSDRVITTDARWPKVAITVEVIGAAR